VHIINPPESGDFGKTKTPSVGKFGLIWFVGLVGLFVCSWVLSWLDDTTELTPSHDGVLQDCLWFAGLSGLASGGVAIWQSAKMAVWRRTGAAFCFALLGALSVFLLAVTTADLVEGWIDFPAGKTRSYVAYLPISRAYRTHGRSMHWTIQTMRIWSNIDIAEDDYDFMLAHLHYGASNSDEVTSKGYFCAQVTIQQSGNALRVMHAGSYMLPKGAVVICPKAPGPSNGSLGG